MHIDQKVASFIDALELFKIHPFSNPTCLYVPLKDE